MTVGRALRLGLATVLVGAAVARAAEPTAGPVSPAEVRVLSHPGRPTILTIQGAPDVTVDDRTPGAHPPAGGQGAASVGETFTDEIAFVLRGTPASRAATVEVDDALVSAVKMFPERDGTQVSVFVRQPVTYSIARPTASGAVAVTLRQRAVAAAPPKPAKPGQHGIGLGARPKDAGDDQVAVDAAELSYDQQANVLIARGGVTLTRGLTTLRADEVRYDRTTSVAEAHGHVVLVDPEAHVEGDAASLDLDDETGWIDDVHADMRQSPYRLTADHVEKRGGPCYGVRDGIFTTCRCGGVERPSWSIASQKTDVTVGGVGVAKDATFRVEDTPVLYMPYLLFPANNDRQTGFLMPRVGYSNRRGFLYEQPFYWAIDKSSDATIVPDLETAARVGVLGEYRYALSRTAGGIVTGGYFNESIGGNPTTPSTTSTSTDVPTNRWVVASRQRAIPWEDGSLYLDVLRVSDNFVLRDVRAFTSNIRDEIQVRSTRYTTSRLGLQQLWDGGAAQVEAKSYQDLIDPQQFALNEVPRLWAEHGIPLLGGLAVARLAGEAVDFQREEGYDGLRLDAAPEVFVPMHFGRYLFGSVRGQVRETAYHLTNSEQVGVFLPNGASPQATFRQGGPFGIPDLKTNETREIAQVNGRLGTEVARVYDFPYLGLAKLRHSIEPELQYLFVPRTDPHLGEVPVTKRNGVTGTFFEDGYLFDEVDAIRQRNFVSYGLTTRLLVRGAAPEMPPAADVAPPPIEPDSIASSITGDDDLDDDLDGDAIEEIDPDTIPQGLPAEALPMVGRPKKGAQPAAAPLVTGSREMLRLSVLHGYDISREISGTSHLSSIDAQLRFTPVDWAGLSYSTSYDVTQGSNLARAVGLILRDPTWTPPADRPNFQSPTSIGIAYRFVSQDANNAITGVLERNLLATTQPIESIDGAFYLRLTDYIGVGFLGRYQLSDSTVPDTNNPNRSHTIGPRFLERDYFARFISRCNCWALEAGMSDRSDINDRTFRVQFTLFGLGSFGQSPFRRAYAGLAGLQALGIRRPRAVGGGFEGFGGYGDY